MARPPVVAVMVTHQPGPWWDEALASLASQTYEDLTMLVLATPATGGENRLRQRVAASAPGARVRVLDDNVGFGPACNQVLDQVKGAAFYLFCHDDVRLDPDVVTLLVEEAFRSTAGVVGPKVVDWDEPRRLLQVGMSVDKFGAPSPQVERGELDQEQHDAVRDVFFVPGSVTLVRADLFASLGGFDPGIDLIGEDIDLCWRAHIAGARVLVAPLARVAHREALDERVTRRQRWSRSARHRLRTTLVCYGFGHRLRVLPQAVVVSLVEAIAALFCGHVDHALAVLAAWASALRSWPGIRRRRRILGAVRVVGDSEVRSLQVRGVAGATRFVHDHLESDRHTLGVAREIVADVREGRSRNEVLALAGLILLVVFGTRDLLLGSIPAVGQFVPFERSAFDLFAPWSGAPSDAGLVSSGPYPTGLLVVGGLGTLALNSLGLVRHLLIIALVPLGLIGMWRLVRPSGRRPVALVATAVYAGMPLLGNTMGTGRWSGLVLYGLAPWLVAQLAAVSADGPAPRRSRLAAVEGDRRELVRRALTLGMLTGLAMLIEPFAIVAVVVLALAWAAGGALAGRAAEAPRVLLTGLIGSAVAAVLHLPWVLGLVAGGWTDTSGTGAAAPGPSSLSAVARFATGPVVDSPLVLGLLVGALFPVFVARDERLVVATRGWVLAAVAWALVWLDAHGIADGFLPAPEVLLATAAVGLALAASMGMAAFHDDLPGYYFGWRQMATVAAGLALVVGLVPGALATIDGRWQLPRGDLQPVLANIEAPPTGTRALWIGDASVMPLRGSVVDEPALAESGSGHRLVYGTTAGVGPDIENLWTESVAEGPDALADVIADLRPGGTTRLGERLARLGISYVVVPRRMAPAPYVATDTSSPAAVLDGLADQLDLQRVDAVGGVTVYRNLVPAPAERPLGGSSPAGSNLVMALIPVALWIAALVARHRLRRRDESVIVLSPGAPRAGAVRP